MAELNNLTTEEEWHTAYSEAVNTGDTEKQEFESKYGTNYTEYKSKL